MKNNENYNKMQAEENESFQTNFFLEFKNEKNRETFSTFYLTSQNLLTEIYLFILIFVMVMIYLLRYCFKIDSNMDFHCRHHFLYFFSLFFLIFTFISIKLSSNLVKNPIFLQICMLFGNLYLYTAIIGLEIIPEVIWISLSIMITICNSIVSVSWKYHLGFLLFSILIIHYYLLFSGNLIYKLYLVDWAIALKIIFYNLVMVALKEKIFKEIWVLINCARDSEKNLEKVIEVIPIPILVVDSNKNIILINRKCTILLHSLENIKEITHSYLHRNFNDFINETDLEIFNSMIAGVYSKNAIYSRIFALQEIQKKMNTSKGADESKHMRKILSDLTEFIEDSDFRSHALHDLTISGIFWKATRCIMIVLKPLQSLQSYLEIKKNLELLTQSNLYFLLNLIEKENFKLKGIGMNLARPPSLYFIQRNSLKGNNFEITPSLLEMYIIKLGLLISQELSYFLQHKFPPKSVFNFKFSDFIFHFTEFFNKIANSKEKINKFNKNEIIISAEILKDLPDIIMGDCERMEEILGFILFPIIRKFHDLVRVVITCDFYKNDELVENKCNFLFSLEIIRKKDDEELEKFLKSQIFEYANKTQSEIYEIILKNLENEELFVTGLNLLPFLLKILDNDYFDITSLEYSTNIKFVIPFLTEQTGKSPTNFLKYNEINLDYFYSRINSRKKLNEKEYDVYRLEKKNQRSFEDFSNAFIKIIEPNSSDSVKGSSSKSSPLKKNRNHKGLREDLLKLVSPENSINSASIEIKINKLNSGSIYRVKKELKFCSNVFEFHKILEKMERKEKELSKNQPNSEKSALMKKQMSFKEKTNDLQSVITNNIENSIEILQEEYKKTLEKTVIECLNLKENIALNEIHEELFNLIVDENKFAFMNQRKDNFQKKIIEKKKFCHSNFSRKKEINKEEIEKIEEKNEIESWKKNKLEQKSAVYFDDSISSITEKKIENQLGEMFLNTEFSSSLKLDEMEEIKEEVVDSHNFPIYKKTISSKNSPNTKAHIKAKFDKILISPINRPLNILKLRKIDIKDSENRIGLGKYLKN